MSVVQDILDQKRGSIVTVPLGTSVQNAASRMDAERIGAVLVLGAEGEMLGIFTERDVLHRVIAQRRDPVKTRVEEVMTERVACCKPNTSLEECRAVMAGNHIRHLPVVRDGELVGIVSMRDVLAQEVRAQQTTIEYLHAYLHGRM
jgi:CBS domain-containing protein